MGGKQGKAARKTLGMGLNHLMKGRGGCAQSAAFVMVSLPSTPNRLGVRPWMINKLT
jgi:hypothetical protein